MLQANAEALPINDTSDDGRPWHCFHDRSNLLSMRQTGWIVLLVTLWLAVPYPAGLVLFIFAAYCHGALRTPEHLRYHNPLSRLARRP